MTEPHIIVPIVVYWTIFGLAAVITWSETNDYEKAGLAFTAPLWILPFLLWNAFKGVRKLFMEKQTTSEYCINCEADAKRHEAFRAAAMELARHAEGYPGMIDLAGLGRWKRELLAKAREVLRLGEK